MMMGGNPGGSFQQQQVSSYGQQRSNMHIGGGGPSSNAHVINQSLKPKMIMNNNSNIAPGGATGAQNRQGSAHGLHSQNQLAGNGDIQVSNISITNTGPAGRPQSSKIVKKKAGASNSHSSNQQNQHSIGGTFINNFAGPAGGSQQHTMGGMSAAQSQQYHMGGALPQKLVS